MTRVLVATPDQPFADRVRQAFGAAFGGSSNGEVQHLHHAFTDLTATSAVDTLLGASSALPDVIALGPGIPPVDALEMARRVDEVHPEINVVLVTHAGPGILERALRAGVRDVISPDATDNDIGLALQRALDSAARRRSKLNGAVGAEKQRQRVIAVVSPKGGSGKTTMATNLAVGLARHEPGKAVLVDLDLTFGDVANALSLVPEHTIGDVLASEATLDALSMKVLLTPHDESGLFVLCAPDTPAEGERITPTQSDALVRFASQEFPYVVIDTGAGLDDHTLAALELCTDIVLLCTMDVPSVRSLRKVVDALDQVGMTGQRRHFVLNRAQTKVGLATEDIERTVGMPVDVAVYSSREVPLSMNEGVPIVARDQRTPVARQLAELVGRFADQPAGARRPGLLERWRTS